MVHLVPNFHTLKTDGFCDLLGTSYAPVSKILSVNWVGGSDKVQNNAEVIHEWFITWSRALNISWIELFVSFPLDFFASKKEWQKVKVMPIIPKLTK